MSQYHMAICQSTIMYRCQNLPSSCFRRWHIMSHVSISCKSWSPFLSLPLIGICLYIGCYCNNEGRILPSMFSYQLNIESFFSSSPKPKLYLFSFFISSIHFSIWNQLIAFSFSIFWVLTPININRYTCFFLFTDCCHFFLSINLFPMSRQFCSFF